MSKLEQLELAMTQRQKEVRTYRALPMIKSPSPLSLPSQEEMMVVTEKEKRCGRN